MPVLTPQEYDASYFDGRHQTVRHNAGYGEYKRWRRWEGVDSLGEFWQDKAKTFLDNYNLSGKKVLDVGCAKGFLVKDLRDLGVDAFGLDVSQYAIDNAEPEAKPFLTVADARTHLPTYKNKEFDLVISLRFFECMDDSDIPNLVSEMNRISKNQVHQIGEQENAQFYNIKTLEQWLEFGWNRGTILLSTNAANKVLVK